MKTLPKPVKHLFPVHASDHTPLKHKLLTKIQQVMERMDEINPLAKLSSANGLTTSAAFDVLMGEVIELRLKNEQLALEVRRLTKNFPASALEENLFCSLDELEMSVRCANVLEGQLRLQFIEELVQLEEAYLLKTRNFGRKLLLEIKQLLSARGLELGTPVPDWQQLLAEKRKTQNG